ncbi:hypothetical protein AaE_016183, partial [Aphanomyces astaci]
MKQLEAAAGDLSRDAVVPAKAVLKISSMTDAFRVELADHRPAVVKQTCGLLGALAWACGASFTCIVEALLVPILLMATKKKQTKVIATAARHCLDCMAKASRFAIVILEKTYHHAKQGATATTSTTRSIDTDDALRMMCLSLAELVLRHGDVDNVMSREVYIPLRRLILKTLRDHNVAVQTHGRMALCLLCEYGQECIAELRHVVDTDLLELAMAEYPESLLATTGRQPEEVATEESMLSVIPEGDEGDVDNSWDALSTVLIGDPASPRSGDQLDWSVSTIEDEAQTGADDDWLEPAAPLVANQLDDSWDDLSTVDLLELAMAEAPESLSATTDRQPEEGGPEASMLSVIPEGDEGDVDNSWDDLSTVLIRDPASPRSGDQLDWSVSTIGDEAQDHGADDDWLEPTAPLVANQLDDSWDDLSTVDLPPESLSSTTDRQPEEGGTEARMLSVIPDGDEGDVDNSWDDLSTVLIGDPASPRSGDELDWSVSTIGDEAQDHGADDDWLEPAAPLVANQLDDSWDDLSTN